MMQTVNLLYLLSSSTTPSDPTDPNQANNIGASFYFVIETAATDLDIKTDGTDKFEGAVL